MIRTGRVIGVLLGLVLLAGCAKGPEDFPRVLVVAVEGADLGFIEPMIEAGQLPTLAGLFREGAHGTLYSTVPPVTPPAWVAATTGKNPGHTGIYQWAVLTPGTYRGDPVMGARVVRHKRVWEILSEAGGRVIAVNIPFTFPPIEINGVMVCGVPADENGIYTYPAALSEQLRQRGYMPFFKTPRPLAEYLAAMADRAAMTAKYMGRLEWNLCWVSLMGLDNASHFYIDDAQAIEQAYTEADRALATLVEAAGPDASVVVFSTHGYHPSAYERYFSVNRWLLDEGFLELRGWLDDSLHVIPFGEEGPTELGRERYQILWPRTLAFSITDCHSNFGHIQINVRGREPDGVVEMGPEYDRLVQEIKRALLGFRDPATGEQIVAHVMTREELFTGERVEHLPDLFFETLPGVLPMGISLSGRFEMTQIVGPVEPGVNHEYPGDHEREGLIALLGPGVRAGVRVDAEILSLAPTLHYLLDLPVPPDFDSDVLREAFTEERLARAAVRVGDRPAEREGPPEFIVSLEPPDSETQELLRALGYLH